MQEKLDEMINKIDELMEVVNGLLQPKILIDKNSQNFGGVATTDKYLGDLSPLAPSFLIPLNRENVEKIKRNGNEDDHLFDDYSSGWNAALDYALRRFGIPEEAKNENS